MKAFKGIMWALLISAMFWAALMFGIASVCHEVDLREEKIVHRAQYIKWWTERDLNTNMTQREWGR